MDGWKVIRVCVCVGGRGGQVAEGKKMGPCEKDGSKYFTFEWRAVEEKCRRKNEIVVYFRTGWECRKNVEGRMRTCLMEGRKKKSWV